MQYWSDCVWLIAVIRPTWHNVRDIYDKGTNNTRFVSALYWREFTLGLSIILMEYHTICQHYSEGGNVKLGVIIYWPIFTQVVSIILMEYHTSCQHYTVGGSITFRVSFILRRYHTMRQLYTQGVILGVTIILRLIRLLISLIQREYCTKC